MAACQTWLSSSIWLNKTRISIYSSSLEYVLSATFLISKKSRNPMRSGLPCLRDTKTSKWTQQTRVAVDFLFLWPVSNITLIKARKSHREGPAPATQSPPRVPWLAFQIHAKIEERFIQTKPNSTFALCIYQSPRPHCAKLVDYSSVMQVSDSLPRVGMIC